MICLPKGNMVTLLYDLPLKTKNVFVAVWLVFEKEKSYGFSMICLNLDKLPRSLFAGMSSCSVCMSFVRLGHHDG